MAKRTTIFAAVFAALLSVAISVQAEVMDYYWVGGGANNNYWTNTNWRIGSTTGETPAAGSMGVATNSITAYILNASADIKFDYDRLGDGVVRLNLGQAGNTDTAVLNRSGQLMIQNGKTLAIGDGGTLNFNPSSSQHTLNVQSGGTLSITGGKLKYNVGSSGTSFEVESGSTMTVSGGTLESDAPMNVAGTMTVSGGNFAVTNDITVSTGGSFTYTAGAWNFANALSVTGGSFTFNNSGADFKVSNAINVSAGTFNVQAANSLRIGQGADATITISGGEVTVNSEAHVGIGNTTGTINQSAGTVTFNNNLNLGWVNNTAGSGHYILSGGTLNTYANAGLWNNVSGGAANTFTMTGGTANFNKTGDSFAIGANSSNNIANAFNLYSGTINAADTFAIQYGGTLFVAKNGEEGGDGVLNARAITLTNSGNLNMSSGTINVGEGGIASSDNAYTITLSGGTFGTNGANWASGLNATISSDAVTFSPDDGKSITWSGVLSGTGGVTKAGAGTLELTGANTYTGKTTVSAGTLKLSGSGKLASSVIDVETGSTLTYYNTTPQNTSPLTFNVNGGTLEFYNDTVTTNAHNQNNAICPGTSNGDVTIYGTGGTLLIDGGGHVGVLNGKNSTVTISMDKNSTIYVKDGYFMNGGYTMQNWSNNQAELKIGSTGIVNLWDGQQMKVGGLTGEAGAQMIDTQTSGQGISVGNGVTSGQSFTYNGTIDLSGKTFDYVGAGKQTLNGNITNANMYAKGGTLILGTAGNELKINSGVLIKADGGAVQVDGNLIVESGTFYPGGTWSTGNGTVTVKSGAVMRVGGTFGPTIGVKLDGGQLFNDGDHDGKTATVSSPITVLSASELKCGWEGSLNLTGGLSGSGNLTVVNDSGITYFKGTGSGNYTGSLTIIGNVRIGDTNTAAVDASTYIGKGDIILKSVSSSRGIFMNNDNHLTFANNLNVSQDSYLQVGWSKSMTFTGNIKGSGRFEVLSDSGWIIMGTKCTDGAFTGDVQTNWNSSSKMGRIRLAADQPFGANAGTAYIYGNLDMNGYSQIFKGLTNDGDKGSIYNNTDTLSTLTLDTTGKNLTFQSSITGNIALVVKGTGTQTLSKAPGYTGSTTLESGTLVLSKGGTLYNLSGAGTLNYGANGLTLSNSADTVYSGALTGSGKVTFQNGTGWIELTQPGTFTGDVQLNYNSTTLEQGRVRLGADNALGTANRAYVYGTLDMNGYDQSFAGLSNDGNKGSIFNDTDTLSTLTIDTTSLTESSKFHSSIEGNIALVLTGTGIMTLTKAPEYTGSTTIESGTLALQAAENTLYNLSGGSVNANDEITASATLDASGKALTLVNSETTKFIGSIKANSIEKTGDGTLQIYSSAAGQVDAGHFLVSSGRLDMKEYYKGTMQVKSGATMSPGNSVGTLTIDGAFILDTAATLLIEQDATGMDKLTASSFTVNPDSILELTYGGGSGSYDILVQSNGDFTGDYATDAFWNGLLTSGSAYFWNLSVNGNVVTASIDANAIPEPSTWALLVLGVVALFLRKRVRSEE
ncbi:MAG: autotransporter-associated beta strand repeat-containing protein [Thermoguttaceae bacterium]|nr:autotransporter-associated beta strand repeat-containing protein [Thermoguttaceae bacterium]